MDSDRLMVESNIVAFMRAAGYAVPEAPPEEALAKFNEIVRLYVLRAMKSILGTS